MQLQLLQGDGRIHRHHQGFLLIAQAQLSGFQNALAAPVPCQCVLEDGELSLRDQKNTLVVPMDPAITLEQLELQAAQLTLRGQSVVSPEAAA